jgi:hypothetical protein
MHEESSACVVKSVSLELTPGISQQRKAGKRENNIKVKLSVWMISTFPFEHH